LKYYLGGKNQTGLNSLNSKLNSPHQINMQISVPSGYAWGIRTLFRHFATPQPRCAGCMIKLGENSAKCELQPEHNVNVTALGILPSERYATSLTCMLRVLPIPRTAMHPNPLDSRFMENSTEKDFFRDESLHTDARSKSILLKIFQLKLC